MLQQYAMYACFQQNMATFPAFATRATAVYDEVCFVGLRLLVYADGEPADATLIPDT